MSLQFFAKRAPRIIVATTACGLLIATSAYALTSNVFQYSAAKNGWLSISSMEVVPDSSSRTYSSTTQYGLTSTTPACFNAGLHLPQGAKLAKITAWYASSYEYTVPDDISFAIVRHRLADQNTELILTMGTSDDSATYKAKTATFPAGTNVIENNAYDYVFQVCLTDVDTFYSARIQYTYTNAGS